MTHNVVPMLESTTATSANGSPALEAQWITDHAAHVTQKGGTTDYGNHPQNRYDGSTVIVAASPTGTVFYENVDTRAYNGFVFEVVSIGGSTPVIRLDVSMDGVTYSLFRPRLINLVNDAVIDGATGILIAGLYALATPAAANVKYRALRLVITGLASDLITTVRYAHVWA